MKICGKVKRWCTQSTFKCIHNKTGRQHLRDWLCYSPSKGTLFCFPCFLQSKVRPASKFCTGFSYWKHAERSVSRHKTSEHHLDSIRAMLVQNCDSNFQGRIDKDLAKQADCASKYRRDILKIIVAVIKLFASRGFDFRGDNEKICSPNNGNFLVVLEVISQFDPFLAQHLTQFVNPGKGNVSYMSSTICEEFVSLLAKEVREKIVMVIKTCALLFRFGRLYARRSTHSDYTVRH